MMMIGSSDAVEVVGLAEVGVDDARGSVGLVGAGVVLVVVADEANSRLKSQ